MVPKWLKDRRSKLARSISNDGPPVKTVFGAPLPKLKLLDGSLSIYQTPAINLDQVQLFRNPSPYEFYGSIISSKPRRHSDAINRLASQVWAQCYSQVDGIDFANSVQSYTTQLFAALLEIGTERQAIQHLVLSVSFLKNELLLKADKSFLVAFIDENNEIVHLNDHSTELIKQTIPKVLVVAKGRGTYSCLTSSIRKVLTCPYPKSGAAELLHFALMETKVQMDVYWLEFDGLTSLHR